MKIVHLYAQNLQAFVDAVKGTECRLHASRDINYLIANMQNYNVRDVMGLIVFANPMTKKCLRLISKFDNLYVYQSLPVIIISDNVQELYQAGYFKVKHSTLYLVTSEEDSISNVDMDAIFTTLLASTESIYDLSGCAAERKPIEPVTSKFEEKIEIPSDVLNLLETLEGSRE